MTIRRILATVTALSLIALPAMARSNSSIEQNGHHYRGGPKTEVPHHMGKKDTADQAMAYAPDTATRPIPPVSAAHQYRGGPRSIH
jgi:hypothetical protein